MPPRLLGREVLDGFSLNSATLTSDQQGRLAIFARVLEELLRDHPDAIVQITGHTDATGGEQFNEQLGQRRADAVADFLVDAGIPLGAIATFSAGETALRVDTGNPEPRNRRAEVRFEPEPRGRPAVVPEPSKTPAKLSTVAELCAENPDRSFCRQDAQPDVPGGGPAGCNASPGESLAKQPAGLRKAIESKGVDPEIWFTDPALDRQSLTAIYNRMCRYGLWDSISEITRVLPKEPLVADMFAAPGLTTVVQFRGNPAAMRQALHANGDFCESRGISNYVHEFPSWREISSSRSLHITVQGDTINAHMDLRSPTPEGSAGPVCSNAPSPSNVDHVVNELMPEFIRKWTGIPGFQMTPEAPPPAAVPPGAERLEPFRGTTGFSGLGIAGLLLKAFLSRTSSTLHTAGKAPRARTETLPLPPDVEQLLDREIPARVARDVLIPAEATKTLTAAVAARENAGLEEEPARITALEAAQQRHDSFAVDAHEFAKVLARRLAQAAHDDKPAIAMELGPLYAGLSPADTKAVIDNVRRIAQEVRAILARSDSVKIGRVRKIGLSFGESVIWEVDF